MDSNRKWDVCKYAWWDGSIGKWQVPNTTENSTLRMNLIVKGNAFFLTNKKTVMESFSLTQKPNEASINFKNSCMVVVTQWKDRFRKFRILFPSNKEAENCADFLKKYIKITVQRPKAMRGAGKEAGKGSIQEGNTLPDVLGRVMSKAKSSIPAPNSIPEDYPLESAIRLCILDPGFPNLVEKVETVIQKYSNNK